MKVTHLTSSRFHGGPERQMIELASALPTTWDVSFLSFSEHGRCRNFLGEVERSGFPAAELKYDTPRLLAASRELCHELRRSECDILLTHGYKANLLGLIAARRLGIPIVAVSRGWTAETWRVRIYDALDKLVLRCVDRVVCVSHGQAKKAVAVGLKQERVSVIHNAVRISRFGTPDRRFRSELEAMFERSVTVIIGAAGRLSPEKGFPDLISAAEEVLHKNDNVGFVLFGEGAEREKLSHQISNLGLNGRFILAGFSPQLDDYLAHVDILALSSYTEGLPNVILEAFALGVPVVATEVGGVPELVAHGVNGFLVPAGDIASMAQRILELSDNEPLRRNMGEQGHKTVHTQFSFAQQASDYQALFATLVR